MERTQIPMPLQAQILMRLALAACSLIAGNVLLVFFTMTIAAPLFLLSLLAAVSGGHLYLVAAQGHYLCLTGIVVRVERTMALRRPKAILMEAEGTALRVVLRNCHKIPAEGHQITFYIQDSTPIYEWKGMHLLGSYLAVTDRPPDKSASSKS